MDRVGEKYITNKGYHIEIIKYFGTYNCTIRFDDGNILHNIRFGDIKNGEVKNPFVPTVLM